MSLPKRYFSLVDQFKTLQWNKKLHFYKTAEQCSFRKGNQIFWSCFYRLKLSHSLLPTFSRWNLSTSKSTDAFNWGSKFRNNADWLTAVTNDAFRDFFSFTRWVKRAFSYRFQIFHVITWEAYKLKVPKVLNLGKNKRRNNIKSRHGEPYSRVDILHLYTTLQL